MSSLSQERMAQKNTGFIIAQNGTRLDGKSQRLLRKYEQKNENLKERVEVAKRYCRASSQ